jgi:hypothetical protein
MMNRKVYKVWTLKEVMLIHPLVLDIPNLFKDGLNVNTFTHGLIAHIS